MVTELSGQDKDCIGHKIKNIYYQALYRKSLPIPGIGRNKNNNVLVRESPKFNNRNTELERI